MKFPLIHKRLEGEILNYGFNYHFGDEFTKFQLILFGGFFAAGFRIRTKKMGKPQFLGFFEFNTWQSINSTHCNFRNRTLNFHGKSMSWELFEEIMLNLENKTLTTKDFNEVKEKYGLAV